MSMKSKKQRISGVPTNIITGFLGVGKTSSILHLLKHKPVDERWAVLVNEFGEIGVDGSLFEGQNHEEQGVFVREVPGGCMCCSAGIPMQFALNVLLTRARPDRLLIEPTGLGHPIEVLEVLSSEHYKEVLSVQKILTLVDARKLADQRYTTHETFNQQIAIADVLVGNKRDLYQTGDEAAFEAYAQHMGSPNVQVVVTEQGVLDPAWLEGESSATLNSHHLHHHSERKPSLYDTPIPESGFIKASNQGDGFYSVGWRFSPSRTFDRSQLFEFFRRLTVERMKGVFITESGVLGYNLTSDTLTIYELDDCTESRIEIIAEQVDNSWEKLLMDCMVN